MKLELDFFLTDLKIGKGWFEGSDPTVQKACVQLVCDGWISQHLNGNLVQMLLEMDVMTGKAAEIVLLAYFSATPDFKLSFDGIPFLKK